MRLVGFIGWLLVTLTSFCQEVISGRVIDAESQEGLIGAHIYLLKNWRKGATTDVDGRFSMVIEKQDYEDSVIVTFIGYVERLIPLQQAMGDILLTEIPQAFDEVVVTASPLIAEEFKFVKINKLDIYTNPSAKADPVLAVNSMPSATTTDESANISLRGSSPIETGWFLNNVPIYDAVRYAQLNGIGTFSIFNTSIVKDVTVFPGNPPLEFGNATSGIISITTDDVPVQENMNSAIVSLASLGYSRDQKIGRNQSLKLFTNWQPSSAIKALNPEALREIENFNSMDLGVYRYGGKNGWQWKIFNYFLSEGYEFNYRHPSYNGVFDQEKRRTFMTASVEKQFQTGTGQLNFGSSYTKGDYRYSVVGFKVNGRDHFLGANYLLSGDKLSFKVGGNWDFRKSAIDGSFHEFGFAQGMDHPTVEVNDQVQSRSIEGFSYLKYFLTDNLALGTGFRANLPNGAQKARFGKQLNLSYTNGPWSIVAGSGNYFKHGLEENAGQLVSVISTQHSVDFKYARKNMTSSLSLFTKSSEINDLELDANGAELFLSGKLAPKLTGSGSFTWVNAVAESGNHPYDLNYFVKANLTYTPGKLWSFEATFFTWEGVRFTEVAAADFNTQLNVFEPVDYMDSRLADYLNLSLAISKVVQLTDESNMVCFASLSNITDHRNERSVIYNADYSQNEPAFFSRRTGYMGVVISF